MRLYQLLYVPNWIMGVGTVFVAMVASHAVAPRLLPGLSELVLQEIMLLSALATLFYFVLTAARNVAIRAQMAEWPADMRYQEWQQEPGTDE